MKFWQKLYLSVLTLFLLVFVFSIFMLVRSVYENNLDMERGKGNREAYWLESRISEDFEAVKQEKELSAQEVSFLLSSYTYDYLAQNSLFSVYHGKELLYTNLDFDDSVLIPNEMPDTALAKVYWLEDRSFYCVWLPLSADPEYALLYLHELTGMSEFMDGLAAICLTTGIVGSVLLAFLLYFLVKQLTRPLGKLDEAAREIAAGKYDTHVTIRGRDEFASVAGSFNDMAGEVSRHIASLEKENQNKQIFIDNLAHEMNTPLTSIRGYGEYLQRGMLTEEERYEALAFITKEAERLSSLGRQLLLLADIREGDFTFTEIQVEELIHSLQKLFQARLEEKKITLVFSSTVTTVTGDFALLESLAANLIENAIRACEPGGRVEAAFEDTKEGWSLCVRDNGRGIPKEAIPYVTEPFYRTDKARSRAHGGAGLGLALCRQIAALHQGSISITSEENKGTEVTVKFTTS